jgi:hypothetical protein
MGGGAMSSSNEQGWNEREQNEEIKPKHH